MLDVSHLIQNQSYYIQEFQPNSVAVGTCWHTWVKPRGVSMVYMYVIGSGGGGSGGYLGANNAANQGGGGASSSQTVLVIPAIFLPDFLLISTTGASGYFS